MPPVVPPWDQVIGRGHPSPSVSPVGDILDVMNEAEKIGQAFVTLVLISRQMGHTDIRSTAREYLLPHASADHSPEQLFVLAAVAGPDGGGMRPDELLPDDDAANEVLGSMALPPLT
jgi:hypothetical protein